MKFFVISCIAFITFFSCNSNGKDVKGGKASNDTTTVEIIDTLHDFGKLTEGDKVTYNFRFKNSGKKPLWINSATSNCGCTVPEVPEKPIMPGEMGYLKVEFNSKGKSGFTQRPVTVRSNAYPDFPELMVHAFVEKPTANN